MNLAFGKTFALSLLTISLSCSGASFHGYNDSENPPPKVQEPSIPVAPEPPDSEPDEEGGQDYCESEKENLAKYKRKYYSLQKKYLKLKRICLRHRHCSR